MSIRCARYSSAVRCSTQSPEFRYVTFPFSFLIILFLWLVNMAADHIIVFFFNGQLCSDRFKSSILLIGFVHFCHHLFRHGNFSCPKEFQNKVDKPVKQISEAITVASQFGQNLRLPLVVLSNTSPWKIQVILLSISITSLSVSGNCSAGNRNTGAIIHHDCR